MLSGRGIAENTFPVRKIETASYDEAGVKRLSPSSSVECARHNSGERIAIGEGNRVMAILVGRSHQSLADAMLPARN